jgi:lipid II:glycine glycyltransferase (peptidoglycan interpeptide bridge formation enzyme)
MEKEYCLMALACTAEPDRAAWDAFVAAHPLGHLLQSYAWGKLKSAFGWEALRLALLDGGRIRAAAQVLVRRVAGAALAYVPRGPVVDWADGAAVAFLLEAVARACRERGAIFLKIEPNLPDDPAWHERLLTLGFRPSQTVQPRTSVVVGVDADDETLLGRMKLKTRYNVRLASRRGVTVRPGTDREDLVLFHNILLETAQRHEFNVHTLAYYQEAHRLLHSDGRGVILFAEREGQVLAAHWVSAFGPEAINLYAASRSEGQRHRPTYLLQFEAIRWARDHGCTRYDLWGGIPEGLTEDQEEEGESEGAEPAGMAGVASFKLGFCGRLGRPIRLVGAYDYPYRSWLYFMYRRTLGG